ncbi:calcium binding egf domain-containing protein [Besnoitia besnoiti]|uniref:Calcium binding egf domain-containing protein n=1 Tax=Besnoitia besnoiti TaxID=94643 RepID=A0A2A9MG63_BESBE|nr:calcium binding egf domain-containing protein [Besnoitia besnoiti]PFH34643.1 calcium binding egf domain-containing protein [Besnoitia besnoiti]
MQLSPQPPPSGFHFSPSQPAANPEPLPLPLQQQMRGGSPPPPLSPVSRSVPPTPSDSRLVVPYSSQAQRAPAGGTGDAAYPSYSFPSSLGPSAGSLAVGPPHAAPMQEAPGLLSNLRSPSALSAPAAGFLGINSVPAGGGAPSIQQIGTIMADLATCDPKTEGICCLARNYCDPNATCFSNAAPDNVFEIINAIPRCTCKEGFEGDGRTKGTGCSNIDECATGEAGCEQICKDFAPGYACSCYEGYKLKPNGKECQDINECATANGGCQHVCINMPGSFVCECASGFALGQDGRSCTDIDECALYDGLCEHRCENIPGAYQCHCNAGYKRDSEDPRRCIDRDECVEGLGDGRPACASDGSEACTNTPGSYSCSCNKGYKFVASQTSKTEKEGLLSGPVGASQEAMNFLAAVAPPDSTAQNRVYHTPVYSYIARNSANHAPGDGAEGLQGMSATRHQSVPTESKDDLYTADRVKQRRLEATHSTEEDVSVSPETSTGGRASSKHERKGPKQTNEQGRNVFQRKGRAQNENPRVNSDNEHDSRSAVQRKLQWSQALDAFTSLAAGAPSARSPPSRQKAPSSGNPADTALAMADLAMQVMQMYGTANKALGGIGTLASSAAPAAAATQIGALSPLLREGENMRHRSRLPSPRRSTGTELAAYAHLAGIEGDDSQQQTWSSEMYAVRTNLETLRSQPWIDPPSLPQADRHGTCIDIDECAEFKKAGLRACKIDELICVNTPGSYECLCAEGLEYDADAASCVDIDECLLAKKQTFSSEPRATAVTPIVRLQQQREMQDGKLLPGRPALCEQQCLNLFGKYECGCYPGFLLQPDGRCEDVNECNDPAQNECEHTCVNLPGSYTCQCKPGFRPDPAKKGACVDVDECAQDPDFCEFGCTNLPGAYECTCPPGRRQRADKRGCEPLRTCREDPLLCRGDHVCRFDATVGNWACSCPDGFAPAQTPHGTAQPPRCVDINECAIGYPTPGRNPCPDLYRPCCLNVAGGFQCVMARRKGLATSRKLYCEAPSFDFQGRLDR